MMRTYGDISGNPVGTTYEDRQKLAAAGVHRPLQAGICGGIDGAESIVISGGYIDDEDYGDQIVYTGHGGNDPATKRQVADQELTRGNAGLARNSLEGTPVRVVRGAGGDDFHSPPSGFRYDGLFRVVDYWHEAGKDGFRIWRFRLVIMDSREAPVITYEATEEPTSRVEAYLQRLIRNTTVASRVKEFYGYRCQICDIQLETPAGPYAEAAHIRALGRPHNGPDVASNVLCLCPNHHVLFDAGAIHVDVNWNVRDSLTGEILGRLHKMSKHIIDWSHVAYHRDAHEL